MVVAVVRIASIFLICLIISDWYFLLSVSEKALVKSILLQSVRSLSHLALEGIVRDVFHVESGFKELPEEACMMIETGNTKRLVGAQPIFGPSKYHCPSLSPTEEICTLYAAISTPATHTL